MGTDGHGAVLAGAGDFECAEIPNADHGAVDAECVGFVTVVIGSARQGAAREVDDLLTVGQHQFGQLRTVPVT